jgi:hypothetical protein
LITSRSPITGVAACCARAASGHAAEQRDELASPHEFRPQVKDHTLAHRGLRTVHRSATKLALKAPRHSITSSAKTSSFGGKSMASVLAVLRLMTNSNLVGCHDRHIGRLSALEDAADIDASLTEGLQAVVCAGHQTTGLGN